MEDKYLFTSERLGFRNWIDSDLDKMLVLNQDEDVMKFFPSLQDPKTTLAFINRMQDEFSNFNFCYFAAELKSTEEFIGFIGIANQDYGETLGKFVDIGWRLKKTAWGNGYATEGARRCLIYAKKDLNISKIFAVAPKINTNSISVMEKIGMQKVKDFTHPKLIDFPKLKVCLLYEINL